MSSDVFVWDAAANGTLPTSYQEADKSLSDWMDVKTTEVNPKFIAFAKQLDTLIKQQPEPDAELLEFYEQFVNETQYIKTAVYVVGLPHYNFMDALRLIVQSAATCGLVVMYGPPATVFLPNGHTLPPEQQAMWQMAWEHMEEAQEYPLKLKDFKKMIEPQFEALAIQNGFVKGVYPYQAKLKSLAGRKGYIKNVSFGQQFVSITCEGGAGDYKIIITIFLLSEHYKTISESLEVEDGLYAIIPLFLENLQYPTTGFVFKTCRVDNLVEFNEFMQKIETIWFPLINRIQTLQDVDSLFHGELSAFFRFDRIYPCSLIVAKLAGNPDFEALVEKERTDPTSKGWGSPWFKEEMAPKMPPLIAYLRQLDNGEISSK